VAGSEFTLHKNTLKLFSGNVTHDDWIFKYCLSSVRCTVEDAFGI
jgi:hypothetical protein